MFAPLSDQAAVDDEEWSLCDNACGRRRKHMSNRCCVHCPLGHTRTCATRSRGSAAHRIYVQSQSADGALPSAPPTPPTGSASTFPADGAEACPICLEERSLVQRSHCGHAMCAPCAEEMRRAGQERCPLCRAQWQVVPEEPLAEEHEGDHGGYVILGCPQRWGHMLGRHPVPWGRLELRLGLQPGTVAGRLREQGLVLRHYHNRTMAQMWWTEHGLPGHPPYIQRDTLGA